MKNNWKPFDLEKALAGEPIIAKGGTPVTEITRFSCYPNTVYGVIGRSLCNWDIYEKDGSLTTSLYMAPKQCTGYVVMYKSLDGCYANVNSSLFNDKERAKIVCGQNSTVGTLTWEE